MTTVRDLLDVAAAELGATSAHLAAGELPRPGAALADDPLLAVLREWARRMLT